ncbi:MAG TPA: hypothetical protein VE987_17715 [Polyangiaceae bacterium]|nr:hypothetical protein [Polyangiaceae bacterium]
MDAPATLVWMAPDPPDAQQSRSLSSWSLAHGVRLTPPLEGAAAPAAPFDPRTADEVETLLDRARDAIAARDGDGADRALEAAESLLRAHPELPQAAWLMAEVERARATRWRRVPPADREAADLAWRRAEALDGGRVTGVGEEAAAGHAPEASLVLDVSPPDAERWLDGRPADERGAIGTRAGPHALVVAWRGVPVWSGWIDAPPGRSTVRATAPVAAPCSSDDVGRARLADRGARGASSAAAVRCASWVAASAGSTPGGVRVALCEAGRCGPELEWIAPPPWSWSPPAERGRSGSSPSWPSWATWALLGTGAALAAGAVVLATGALQPAPSGTRFVSGGIKSQ